MAAFHRGKFSRRYVRTSIFNDVARAIIPSLLFHSLAYFIIERFESFTTAISFRALGILLVGGNSDKIIQDVFQHNIGSFIPNIFCYLSSSILFGLLAGWLFVLLIRHFHLDLKYELLRFDNEWYYALSGEALG